MLNEEILKTLEEGKLIIIPTDTVYGISCDATNIEAIKKVNEAKKRKEAKPLLILVSDIEMLKKYTQDITPLEEKLMHKYMPGKLTMLFKKNDLLSDELTAGSPYIAIRIPEFEELLTLIKKFNKPIVSTSANITGSDVVASLENLENDLKEKIDYIYDIGILNTTPSTLLKVEKEKIIILREGELANKIKEEFKSNIK